MPVRRIAAGATTSGEWNYSIAQLQFWPEPLTGSPSLTKEVRNMSRAVILLAYIPERISTKVAKRQV